MAQSHKSKVPKNYDGWIAAAEDEEVNQKCISVPPDIGGLFTSGAADLMLIGRVSGRGPPLTLSLAGVAPFRKGGE